MSRTLERRDPHRWGDRVVAPGERVDLELDAMETHGGAELNIPVHVWRAATDGPCLLVTAALHGDEINGTGAVRELLLNPVFELVAGTLLLVPVVNLPAYERHSRYLPDRRDLNRAFPGSADGSMAKRLAFQVFRELVARADYGVDLHSAAVRRTNLPNIRADLSDPEVGRLARAFGTTVVIDNVGPDGSLRREACKAGRPTILLEAGEVWKVEPTVAETAVHGVRNLLIELGMVEGEPSLPPHQMLIEKTKWVRAETGGFLRFHVGPGDLVRVGQELATNTSLLGVEQNVLASPIDGIVIGMTTLPAVAPGDAVYHIAQLSPAELDRLEHQVDGAPEESLIERTRSDLGTSVLVDDPDTD